MVFQELISLYLALSHGIERVRDALCRLFIQEAHDIDGAEGKDEARDDLVEAEEGELLPYEDGDAARDDARKDAVPRGAAPEERGEQRGAEGGAEACPCVGDHVEDEALGIHGKRQGKRGNREDGEAADPDEFALACVLMKQRAVEILREGRSCDEELRRRRAHDGGEDGGEDESRDEGVEDRIRHHEEDRFRRRAEERLGKVGVSDHADENGGGKRDGDPRHGDVHGASKLSGRADRHEAHEDVRLAEVAESPAHERDELDEAERRAVGLLERIEERRLHRVDGGERHRRTAEQIGGGGGHEQDGEEHHDALDEVRPADGEEAARERVEDDDESAEEQRLRVGKRENSLKELAACDEARRRVDDEEDQNEDGGDDAQEVRLVLVAILQKIGQRQRIVGKLRIFSKTCGNELPVRISAERKPQGDPARIETRDVGEARQPHEHPAAHVGSLGAQGRDPRAELAVAEDVVRHGARAPIVVDADEHHEADVDDECDDDRHVVCQDKSS